jgi:hypothetical protein
MIQRTITESNNNSNCDGCGMWADAVAYKKYGKKARVRKIIIDYDKNTVKIKCTVKGE